MSKIKIMQDEKVIYEGVNAFVTFGAGTGQRHIKPEGMFHINEKKAYKQSWLDLIESLKEDYKETLGHIQPDAFLVEVDVNWELTEKTTPNSRWKIDIKKTTRTEHLFTGASYVLKCKEWWLNRWNDAQIHAAFMSQLLRVHPDDGSVLKHTEDFPSQLVATFGDGYLDEHVSIPDMLETKVQLRQWPRADKQARIGEYEESERPEPMGEGMPDGNVVNMKRKAE
jgi:hypothetical protein